MGTSYKLNIYVFVNVKVFAFKLFLCTKIEAPSVCDLSYYSCRHANIDSEEYGLWACSLSQCWCSINTISKYNFLSVPSVFLFRTEKSELDPACSSLLSRSVTVSQCVKDKARQWSDWGPIKRSIYTKDVSVTQKSLRPARPSVDCKPMLGQTVKMSLPVKSSHTCASHVVSDLVWVVDGNCSASVNILLVSSLEGKIVEKVI